MDAAREVFEEKGYDGALISDIAERAQVVEGTIYRYFENKRALLTSVVERWYAGMLSD
jgi:TetR/AcrR family transcriptional regulator, fatty acid metabolism regulator protein